MDHDNAVCGVGMNLRLSYLDTILDTRPAEVAFWEIIAENLFDNPRACAKVEAIRRDYPISLHCVGMNLAGTDPLNTAYLDRIRHLSEVLDPFLVSDHLCWQKHNSVSHHDLLPFPLTSENAGRIAQRIAHVQQRLDRPIAIENLSYYVEFRASTEHEDALLNAIASETGCGIILDLNNIEVNALNLGHSKERYLDELDFRHVVEVHVAGPEEVNGLLLDTHGSLPSSFQTETLANTPALQTLPVCYERDNQIPPLSESLAVVNTLRQLRQ